MAITLWLAAMPSQTTDVRITILQWMSVTVSSCQLLSTFLHGDQRELLVLPGNPGDGDAPAHGD